MKWRVCWFLLASIIHSKSHPIEELENVRESRAVEECCPCPKPGARSASNVEPPAACPCLPSGADSEGAPSILTQTVLRAARPFLRPESKEEVKPLLHPEVDLASSVLNTLREATEEEYHDALARDAARSVAREADDEEPATNIINIIVSPESTFNKENLDNENDAMPDASHVQETRCLPSSLGRANSKVTARKPPSLSKHIFGLESKPLGILHKNVLDMDNAASTIHEHVLESVNNGLKGLKLRSNPSLLNLFPNESEETLKSILSNFMSVPKLRENDKIENSNTKTQAVNLKNTQNDFDPKTAASNMNENVLKVLNRESPDLLKLKPIVKASDKTLKNLIKLKDVELLPPKKVTLPRLKLPELKLPLIPAQRKSRKNEKDDKSGGSNTEECTENIKNQVPKSNIQTISKRIVHTEIIDAAPSPSENQNVFFNNSEEKDLSSDEGKDEKDFNNINDNEQLINLSNKETNSAEVDSLNDLNKDEFVITPQSENIFEQSAEDVETKESQLKTESITDRECVETDDSLENIKKKSKASENPLSKLASFHDDLIKKLKMQRNKKTFKSNSLPSTINDDVAPNSNNEDNCNDSSVLQPISIKQGLEDETESITSMPSNPVSFKDLQTMSDSLLDASMTQEKTSPSPTCTADEMSLKAGSIGSSEEFIDNQVKGVDDDKILKPFNIDSNDKLSDDTTSSDDEEQSKSQQQHESIESNLNNNLDKVDPCVKTTTTTTLSPLLECNRDDCLKKEMEVAASDPISDTVSRLFPSAKNSNNLFGPSSILQPSSLINGGELDFLRPVDIGNILNFNTQLPTLEELRSRVSSLLGMGINLTPAERLTDFFSSELESDFTNTSPVISRDASEPFSSLAPLRPLEDLDIDIFQLKPLGMSPGTKLSMPGFGLNSIKAKLPIPKSLHLKPLRLESSVGNKEDGLLGSILTLGPSPLGSKKNNNYDILHSPSSLIESLSSSTPIQSLPSLHNVRSNLRKNAQNLISSSSGAKQNSLLNLPTNDITTNLRTQSDKAVKKIQKTIDSTFKQPNGLSSSLPKPEHILGMVSQAHDDINNKLEDLHSDLTNQITSFRHSILKDTAPKISPVLGKPRTYSKLDFPRTHTQVIEGLPKGFKSKKPQAKAKSSSIRTVDRMNRLSTAASVPVPKTVTVPKLRKSEDAPLRIRESVLKSNMDSLKPLIERKSLSDLTRRRGTDSKNDKLFRPYKPLGDFKVSFGTTSTTTTTARTPLFKKRIAVPTTTRKPALLKSRLDLSKSPQAPTLRDSFKLSQKDPHSSTDPTASSTVLSKSSLSNQSDKVVPKKVKQKQVKTQKDLIEETEPEKFVWPNLDDNSFISKVREAVKTRLANLRNPKAPAILPQARSRTGNDMSLGASEVVERKTALKSNAPLKENVAYKCKLVCVKEVINSDENN